MKLDAVLHIPMSEYAHGIDENHVVFRLRCAKGDLKRCTLHYGDTACRVTPIIFTSVPMELVLSDQYHDYYQVILDSPYQRLYYYFELDDGRETVLYYGDVFTDHLVDDRSEYFKLPFNHRADIAHVPDWVHDAVVYNIFPDSFASAREEISLAPSHQLYNGVPVKGRLGGTLWGMAENAGYLQELGVNCVYLNPIFAAGEYHKYDLLDYYHVDPCFGGDEAFRAMVDEFHKRDIRVIIDGVFNHCGWHFFAFDDVVRNQEQSRYKDWFYRLEFPVVRPADPETYPSYACFGYERMMPKLDTANPEVRDYFAGVGAYWVREFGIDGWRLAWPVRWTTGSGGLPQGRKSGRPGRPAHRRGVGERRPLAERRYVRFHHELRLPQTLSPFLWGALYGCRRIFRPAHQYAHTIPGTDAPRPAQSAGQPRCEPLPVPVRRGCAPLSAGNSAFDVLCRDAHHFLRG